MIRHVTLAAVATLALAGAASAQSTVRVGTLDCSVAPGVGLIIGSTRSVGCRFTGTNGRRERYAGDITKVGLDVGVTGRARMVWAVFAPTRVFQPGALAGDYVGASADAAVGVGGGAKLLVGGSNRTFSLQPLSLQGQAGVNLAVGVAGLHLNPAR